MIDFTSVLRYEKERGLFSSTGETMPYFDLAKEFMLLVQDDGWDKACDKGASPTVIESVLRTVGFDADKVVKGKVHDTIRLKGGVIQTFVVNEFSPYKVLGVGRSENIQATRWLELAIATLRNSKTEGVAPSGKDTIFWFARAIEVAMPLKPVLLTNDGEFLEEHPRDRCEVFLNGDPKPTAEEKTVSKEVGLHAYCTGRVIRLPVSEKSDVLCCKECNLRVLFDRRVKTYGQLRDVLRIELEKNQKRR